MAQAEQTDRSIFMVQTIVIALVVVGVIVGATMTWLRRGTAKASEVSQQLDASVIAVYNSYNGKEVNGQTVLNAMESFPQLSILVGHKISAGGSYEYSMYNHKLGLIESQYNDMKCTSQASCDRDKSRGILTGRQADKFLNDDLSESISTSNVPVLSSKQDVVKKSNHTKYIPPYARYYSRLAVYNGEVTGIVFKELLTNAD